MSKKKYEKPPVKKQVKNQRVVKTVDKDIHLVSLIHDMKVPLSIIRHSLSTYIDCHTKEKDKDLKIAKNTLERVCRDINNILDMEKIIHNQPLYLHNEIINITGAIKEIIEIFKRVLDDKGMKVLFDGKDDYYVKINPSAFDRVINNILDNAIKYSPANSEIRITISSDSSFINIAIEDNGKGIPVEDIKKIFTPFFRGTNITPEENGIGMGLSIIKGLLATAGGTVNVKSIVNKRTVFTIGFPKLVPGENEGPGVFTPESPVNHTPATFIEQAYEDDRDSLLVVDSNIQLLAFLQKEFLHDYNFFCASSVKEAKKLLLQNLSIDIVVTDSLLKDMDGIELYTWLIQQESYLSIPVIFLSSKADESEKLKILGKGVIDFITKPFSVDELKAKIASLLRYRDNTRDKERIEIQKKISSLLWSNKPFKNDIGFEQKCLLFRLSNREIEVLSHLLTGLQIKEIAKKLDLSVHTVRNHVQRIYKKCDVQNRVAIVNLFKL